MSFAKKLLFILLCLLPMASWAQLMSCRGFLMDGYDFWLYLPDDYDASTKKPVILFLHGRSLSGEDLDMVRQYGCINALQRGRDIDAIVIAPQAQTAWDPSKVTQKNAPPALSKDNDKPAGEAPESGRSPFRGP